MIRDKGHYIMMKRLILQEDITVPYHVCVCLTTERQTAWGKKMIALQREIDKSITTVGDQDNHLS